MIKLIVLDVDGCLTDGKIIYDANGVESKQFDVKDGLAVASWIKMGGKVAIITGRESAIVQKRADELGVQHLFQGVRDKLSKLQELCEHLQIKPCEVAAIGDDLNDYEMLRFVRQSFTPSDGAKQIVSLVTTVLQNKGGNGAVREMIEMLIQRNNQEEQFLALWIKG